MAGEIEKPEALRFWEIMAFGGYLIGLATISFFSFSHKEDGLKIFGVLTTVATAAWLTGTALGFLFGIPRVRSTGAGDAGDPTARIVPNTNLEQISDWLTKIIVGATLVQLGPLVEGVGRLAVFIGQNLGGAEGSSQGAAVSGGVLVLNFAAGFVWGYLWCSLRVFREMQSLVERERRVLRTEHASQAIAP